VGASEPEPARVDEGRAERITWLAKIPGLACSCHSPMGAAKGGCRRLRSSLLRRDRWLMCERPKTRDDRGGRPWRRVGGLLRCVRIGGPARRGETHRRSPAIAEAKKPTEAPPTNSARSSAFLVRAWPRRAGGRLRIDGVVTHHSDATHWGGRLDRAERVARKRGWEEEAARRCGFDGLLLAAAIGTGGAYEALAARRGENARVVFAVSVDPARTRALTPSEGAQGGAAYPRGGMDINHAASGSSASRGHWRRTYRVLGRGPRWVDFRVRGRALMKLGHGLVHSLRAFSSGARFVTPRLELQPLMDDLAPGGGCVRPAPGGSDVGDGERFPATVVLSLSAHASR